MSDQRTKINLNVYLVLFEGDKVLLSLRQNTGYEDGKWSLVAGHCEAREQASQALCREAREEAGLEILPESIEVLHVMHRLTDRENIDLFMGCRQRPGAITNCEPAKCGGLQFFSLSDLPENTIPYIRKALEHIQKHNFYSESGWPHA